jgi:hypothetical protein
VTNERPIRGEAWCDWIDPVTRRAIVASVRWSQRLAGVEVTEEQAEALLLAALHEPPMDLDRRRPKRGEEAL